MAGFLLGGWTASQRVNRWRVGLFRCSCACLSASHVLWRAFPIVCTENLILFDYVTESPNVNGDDRAALLPPDPVRLAIQVEEST